jgi:predicted GNAT family acetyltransferase
VWIPIFGQLAGAAGFALALAINTCLSIGLGGALVLLARYLEYPTWRLFPAFFEIVPGVNIFPVWTGAAVWCVYSNYQNKMVHIGEILRKPLEISAIRRGKNLDFFGSGGEGLSFHVQGDRMKVISAFVPEELRGKGRGVAMYEHAIQYAQANNLRFVSDKVLTKDSARVYDSLKRRGYTIQESPEIFRHATGLVTHDESPAFEVMHSPRSISNEIKPKFGGSHTPLEPAYGTQI